MSMFSSWNSEISSIYPQYSLQAINRLERTFCEEIKWELYISSSTYAKYYFALRSLTEKKDFRRYMVHTNCEFGISLITSSFILYRKYNVMMVNAPGEDKIAERSDEVKQQMLSRSF